MAETKPVIIAIALVGFLAFVHAAEVSPSVSSPSPTTSTSDPASYSDSASGSDSDSGGSERRDLDITFDANKLEIESKSRNNGDKSRIRFETTSQEGFKLRLRLKNETADGSVKTDFRFRFRLEKLVEFDPAKFTDGVYNGDGSEKTAIKVTDLTKTDVTLQQGTSFVANDVSVNRYIYEQGSVKITLYVGDALFSLPDAGAMKVSPESIKFDIEVKGYSFASTSSRLAMIAKLDADAKDKLDESKSSKGDDGVVSIGTLGYFNFAKTATCAGGTTVNVISTAPTKDDSDADPSKETGEETNRVAFTFSTATQGDICWDPVMGTNGDAPGNDGGDGTGGDSTSGATAVNAVASGLVTILTVIFALSF